MKNNRFDNSEEWNLYQRGLDYNNKIGLYSKNELYHDFYNGNQWRGVVVNGLPKYTFNICKSSINYFVSFICSQKIKIQYTCENIADEPDNQQDIDKKEFASLMTDMATMKWEKDKMDDKLRKLILDAGITGDFCAYVYWDATKETGQYEKGDFCTEMVDGVNVMFGNPNCLEVEKQPYILIIGRDMVSRLKEEAKKNGISQEMIDTIQSDSDTNYQEGQGGKVELDNLSDNGKCNYIIKYYKKDGKVFWNKSTKHCPIVKEIDLDIKVYPIAFGNWDSIKNSYHGMSAVEGIIDNQISINQLFAMVSYWMKMMAFGKVAYDSTRIKSWNNKVGAAVAIDGDTAGAIQQLNAGNFQGAVLTVIDMAIKYTKEFIGANDSLMGQVNPEQASGTAIITTAKQASMPLGNISANRDQFVEDLGIIWGEFFLRKYRNRDVLVEKDVQQENGEMATQKVKANYNSDNMQDVLMHCTVDVGASSMWSEITAIQSLDNLLNQGHINKLQYFERMQKMNIIPDCKGLIDDTKREMEQATQQPMQEEEQPQMDYEQMAMFIESLPPELQQQLQTMPDDQMEQAVMELMQQQQ